ncbi:MAG: GDP-mannose 4,6-dehydratase [Acidobacteriota bacterium]|nr:GDP-mannose 4,6-dehydratase [Acidobacteriota bacterium]
MAATTKTRVLMTGATGFVGRHLMRELDGGTFEMAGTSFPEAPAEGVGNIVRLDLRDRRDLDGFVREVKPEWVFHLAAVSNVGASWERREETFDTNLTGTFNLFESVRRHVPECRVLYVSSSDVYGIVTEKGKILTEDEPAHAVNPYAYTKAAGEMLARFYAEADRIGAVIVRPFPHTGPGQTEDFVCSDWARQIVRIERGESEPVIAVGNLDVRRDFSDVRDIVRAYRMLLEKGRAGEIYNVCSGRAVALREIMEMLLRQAALPGPGMTIGVEVDSAKLRKIDVPLLVGSNAKIRRETGWGPEIPLERTLSNLLSFWRSALAAGYYR